MISEKVLPNVEAKIFILGRNCSPLGLSLFFERAQIKSEIQ
jgi:hypothetical protein